MRKQITALFLGVFVLGLVAAATQTVQAATKEERLTAKKKKWLKQGFAAQMSNPAQIRAMNRKLDDMTPEEIDQLVRKVQGRLAQVRRQQFQQALAYRNYLLRRQAYANRYGYGRPIGYAPVVTWLPQGASMTAGAVVSPDRRHVRINAQPFFSNIGPVHTFNMRTGQYKRIR